MEFNKDGKPTQDEVEIRYYVEKSWFGLKKKIVFEIIQGNVTNYYYSLASFISAVQSKTEATDLDVWMLINGVINHHYKLK